jgi:hypothetical protein
LHFLPERQHPREIGLLNFEIVALHFWENTYPTEKTHR